MRKPISKTILAAAVLCAGLSAAQLPIVVISVDENGHGTLAFQSQGSTLTSNGVMKADPGPGGRSSALTYSLLGPPSLVAGDLVLSEPGGDALSDIIRFNPLNTDTQYPASLVFYSDNLDGSDSLANTGFPASLYTNVVRATEVGVEGSNGFTYTPTDGQPGFVAGFNVTYDITSDAVPEPASASLVVLAGALLLAGRRWMKRAV